jgi:hypothetical protein
VNAHAFRRDIAEAFRSPSGKQKEAYARFAHTLAAASLIGAVTLLFAEAPSTWGALWRIAGLAAFGVLSFLGGSVLLKDERPWMW